MNRPASLLVAALLLVSAPTLAPAAAALAQGVSPPDRPVRVLGPTDPGSSPAAADTDTASEAAPSTALMVGGGLLGGGVGVLGGGYLGARIADDTCRGEGCYAGVIYGAFAGAVIAESVLLPLGVHVAAGGRGDLGPSMAASAGFGVAALALGITSHADDPLAGVILAAVPLAQLTVSILNHR